MSHWINTTITTEKGPQSICINTDHIKYVKQKDDGRTIVVFVQGQAEIIDDSYARVINLIVVEPT